jgi:hypothetical protein
LHHRFLKSLRRKANFDFDHANRKSKTYASAPFIPQDQIFPYAFLGLRTRNCLISHRKPVQKIGHRY